MNYSKMNVKLLFERANDPTIMQDFRMLAEYRKRIASLDFKSLEHKVLRTQMKDLRQLMRQKPHSFYKIRSQNGKLFNEQWYDKLPDPMGFKEVVDDYAHDLREIRRNSKHIETEEKNIFGFRYSMIGGAFKPGSKQAVLAIGQSTDPFRRIRSPKIPHDRIKAKYVGIELELMSTMDQNELSEAFIKESLAGYVYLKTDTSIQVEQSSERGHEVTLLCRQEDVPVIIEKVCKVLNNKNGAKAKVNNSCGFHLHIDMRHRDPYVVYNNLVRGLPLLNKLVPPIRVNGDQAVRYCRQNTTRNLKEFFPDPANIRNTRMDRGTRYQAINPYSLIHLNTIEVRMHSGTTNAHKITMWSKICTALADAPELTQDITTIQEFEEHVLHDSKVSEYMLKRITLFQDKKEIDTRADWQLDMMEVG